MPETKNKPADHLKARRKELQLTQKQVADHCKTTPACYGQWERGETSPTGKRLILLAQLYNFSTTYVLTGLGPKNDEQVSVANVPVVSMQEIRKGFTASSIERKDSHARRTEFEVHADRSFWVVNDSDAMETMNTSRSIPRGCYLLVDQGKKPTDNSVVIVNYGSKAVLRKLIFDGGAKWLHAYNSRYKTTKLSRDSNIIGVVVAACIDLHG